MTQTLDVARVADSFGRLSRQQVSTVMRPAVIVPDEALLHEALAEMVRRGVHHAAAVDREGRCLGVLDDRSAVQSWAAATSPLHCQTVRSLLAGIPAVICTPAVIGQVAELMAKIGVAAVAVADHQGHPVGIITGADLVALLTGDADNTERK